MTVETDSDLLRDTARMTGHEALAKNIEAAMALANAVRSTLGPFGLDKMLVDDEGRILVTNDGVTVIDTARVEHPAAKMIISASTIQDEVARDGTTSTILLASELLVNAWELIQQGIHPAQIAAGYRFASEAAVQALPDIAREMNGDDELLEATMTSLAGKGQSSNRSHLAGIAVKAAQSIAVVSEAGSENGIRADPTLVKVIANRGGIITDSHLVRGLVLAKSCIHPDMIDWLEGGKVLLIDGGLERRAPSLDATLKITSPGMLNDFRERDRELLRQQIDAVIALSPNLVVIRDGVDDEARQWLADAGITAYRRVESADLDLLSRASGATMIHRPEDADAKVLGTFTSSREELWEETTHWILEGSAENGATLVICGTTEEVMAEVERCFDDALGVACQLLEEPYLLPGGGATHIALARRIRRHAEGIPGREQLAAEGFADALEVIPRTLAENSGIDPIDALLQLVAAQTAEGDWVGLDADDKSPADMDAKAIREPLRITRQVIRGATDSAICLLRIDDVLWAQQEPTVPDGVFDQD
jgi:chaperonin GroEL (HSP60 family)